MRRLWAAVGQHPEQGGPEAGVYEPRQWRPMIRFTTKAPRTQSYHHPLLALSWYSWRLGGENAGLPPRRGTTNQPRATPWDPGRNHHRSSSPERAAQACIGLPCAALSGLGSGPWSPLPGRCPGLFCCAPSGLRHSRVAGVRTAISTAGRPSPQVITLPPVPLRFRLVTPPGRRSPARRAPVLPSRASSFPKAAVVHY